MALTFSLSVVTGIGFHLAGRGSNHEAWHNWAVSHIVSTLLWLIVVVLHTKRYRKMFMSLAKRRAYKKFFPTLVASSSSELERMAIGLFVASKKVKKSAISESGSCAWRKCFRISSSLASLKAIG